MKDNINLHLKIQEMIDCFATTDPLKEMSIVANDRDTDEAALKWVALAALHGINNNAKAISISQSKDGKITVNAKYRESQLPSPGHDIGKNVIRTLRSVTHIDDDKGKLPLALGIRDGSIDLVVKVDKDDGGENITLKFNDGKSH